MAVITYNDQLRNLLTNVECVLAFDTAADFLGLTNGGYRSEAQIFVNKKQKCGKKVDSSLDVRVNRIFGERKSNIQGG